MNPLESLNRLSKAEENEKPRRTDIPLLAIGNLVLAHYVQEHCSRLLRKAKRDAGHLLHHLGHDLARALPQALRHGYAVNLPSLS